MTEWLLSLNEKIITRFNLRDGAKLVIGRGIDADIIVDNTAISRQHASLELRDGQYILSDLGSMNGTFVNDKKIEASVYVTENDVIKLGKFILSKAKGAEQSGVSSFAVLPDVDDKTIIVKSKDIAEKAKGVERPEYQLSLTEGRASPNNISLKGKNSIKIGKSPSCDMVLSGLFIAEAQCYIVRQDENYKIIPQRSWAGTFLNNKKIKDECTLHKGDIIKIRSTKIRFD